MKKLWIAILISTLALSGCQGAPEVPVPEAEPTKIEQTQEATTQDQTPTDPNFEPLTLEFYVGDLVDDLTDEEVDKAQPIIDAINKEEQKGADASNTVLDQLYDDLDDALNLTWEEEDAAADKGQPDPQTPDDEEAGSTDDAIPEPWTLDDYLGFNKTKLTSDQLGQVQKYLDQINEEEQKGSDMDADLVDDLYAELKALQVSFGLRIAATSFKEFIDMNEGKFTPAQKDKILELEKTINDLNESGDMNGDLDKAYEDLEKLLTEAGFDANDVISEVETGGVQYAKFEVNGTQMTIVGDTSKITKEDMVKYRFLVAKTQQLIPVDQMKYLQYLVINSDGVNNTLAYVAQENDELTKFRMALDINDAFDAKGKYIADFDTTIVHEFAHLLSLNASQMQKESTGTYENEEGILAKKSYLNLFFQKFWTDIYEEFQEAVDPSDESGEGALAFYDKYADQFVSDYAATNPEEDFAETFRVFVFEDKPTGGDVKDQKVAWLHTFEDLVAYRADMRKALKLDE